MSKKSENLYLKNNDTFLIESNQSKLALKISEDESKISDESNDEERANWGNRLEFLLACVGYSVGLGNVWFVLFIFVN